MLCSGVRSSCDILAKNSVLARLETSASLLAIKSFCSICLRSSISLRSCLFTSCRLAVRSFTISSRYSRWCLNSSSIRLRSVMSWPTAMTPMGWPLASKRAEAFHNRIRRLPSRMRIEFSKLLIVFPDNTFLISVATLSRISSGTNSRR
ncbi:hypothetical protein ES703_52238 [subsurface metagenome]